MVGAVAFLPDQLFEVSMMTKALKELLERVARLCMTRHFLKANMMRLRLSPTTSPEHG